MTNTQTTEQVEHRMTVAKTIVQQINATDFWARARWGVKQALALGSGTSGVQFSCTKGIKIRVVLDPSDTYSVEIGRVRRSRSGWTYTKHYEMSDVYADVLVQVIDRAFSNAFGAL